MPTPAVVTETPGPVPAVAVDPVLFGLREIPTAMSGTTTVSKVAATSPVEEYGPDD